MNTLSVLIGAVFGCVLAGCVTALAWHGTVDGQAAIGFFTGLSVAGIVGGVQHVATRAGARAAMRQEKM